MNKQCGKCKEVKSVSKFHKHSRAGEYQGYCKACSNINAKERKIRNAKYIWEEKAKGMCFVCGEDHPATLDFHHRDPETKRKAVGKLANTGCSLRVIQEEIDKCNIICSNCHRIVHYNEK